MDDELKAALETLTRGQENLTQGLERLAQGQETLTRGQETLTRGQETLTRGQETLAQELDELRTAMVNRFERIEDKLTSLSEDVSVNMMAVVRHNDLRKAERADVEQMRSLVLKMEQQVLRLRTDVDELKKAS